MRVARTHRFPLTHLSPARRFAASDLVHELRTKLTQKRDVESKKISKLLNDHGDVTLSDATLKKVHQGMRGITGLIYEPSLLDPEEGIRFRGYTIPECQKLLPKAEGSDQPLPEAMFWLLLTGEVPKGAQAKALNEELQRRADPKAIATAKCALDALPKSMHPMSQYVVGLMALQHHSKFAAAYAAGKINKSNQWEFALEDVLDCVACSPQVAAMVYRRLKSDGTPFPPLDPKLDWASNFTRQLGFTDDGATDCLRLYLTIHADHEGGNVSAHTTMLVGSALSDPYLSYAAGMNGLAGPLHGLANQEVLSYLFEMRDKCKQAGVDFSDQEALKKELTKLTWSLLDSKRVVPGYGHAVLRRTDPRYTCQREFAAKHFPDDGLFKLVDTIYQIMPGILTKHGKTANPYPNVDAHSGVLLQHYGLTEQTYYTVLFGVSRQLGVFSGLMWDRLRGRSIERPKSVTSDSLLKRFCIE